MSGSTFLRREHAASYCMSLREAKRRGNPYSLRQHKTKSNTLGKSEKRHEFAQTAANLPGIPAGMRIATPRRYKLRILRPGFSGEKSGLSHSAASPSPGRTSAPRFPFLHWFAMTCKNMWRGCVCKDVARNDMQRAGACMDVWRGGAQKVETCQRRQGCRAQGHAEDRYVSAPRGGIGAAT